MAKKFEGLPRTKGRIVGSQAKKTPRSYESHPNLDAKPLKKGMTRRPDMKFKA